MAKTNYAYQGDRTIPDASAINSPFVNLKNNTDGTTSKIDTTNVRSESITLSHLDPVLGIPNKFLVSQPAGTTTINSTTWTDIHNIAYTWSADVGKMLRVEFNPYATITNFTGVGPDARGAGQYYLQIWMTVNGVDTPVSPIFGYGTITDGRGYTGARDETTTFYTRNPISYISIPNGNYLVTAVKLKGRVDNGTFCSVVFDKKWGFVIQPII